jgi:predicted acyltransferase
MATTFSEPRLDRQSDPTIRRAHAAINARRLFMVGGGLVLLATTANVLLATALRGWLAVPSSFEPLGIPTVASFTIIGMIGAILVFAWTARTQADPGRRFTSIAAAGLVISWLPDLFIWATRAFPGTSTAGVLSLITLHLVAASCAVLMLSRYGVASERF